MSGHDMSGHDMSGSGPERLVLLGVTGGIAAYKAAALASQLVQAEIPVQVILTESASRFIGAPTFAALTGRPVAERLFDPKYPLGAHIELARAASLLCVAPASANFLSKAAHGLSDDLLSTTYLAFPGPVLLAPAMNTEMWEHPAVQRNVSILQDDGVALVGPDEGWLSCRTRGAGRMASPEEIHEALKKMLPI